MTAHAGCRPICTSYHAADCPVAHPQSAALADKLAACVSVMRDATRDCLRLRAALTRIKEMPAEYGCDLECVEKMREIAEEALQ